MISGLALLCMLTVPFVVLLVHYKRIFQTKTRLYSAREALLELISDVKRAKEQVVVVCDRCDIDVASDADKAEFVEAVKRASERGVKLCLVIRERLPEILK